MFKKLSVVLLLVGFLFSPGHIYAASATNNNKINDLSKAYEVWKNKGIKFVVRDSKGKFVAWNTGTLESWGTKSKWVVRDPKGRFLHHAYGKVENWKNGKTRLVVRDPKGRMMTHIDVSLTDKGTFYSTVVGLRRLKNDKFLNFVQGSLADILIVELKDNQLGKARVLVQYLEKYYSQSGVSNFKPVLKHILPTLNFMLVQQPENKRLIELVDSTKAMIKKL
jgi:hypothetical protein